jgi:hypothetical protein
MEAKLVTFSCTKYNVLPFDSVVLIASVFIMIFLFHTFSPLPNSVLSCNAENIWPKIATPSSVSVKLILLNEQM